MGDQDLSTGTTLNEFMETMGYARCRQAADAVVERGASNREYFVDEIVQRMYLNVVQKPHLELALRQKPPAYLKEWARWRLLDVLREESRQPHLSLDQRLEGEAVSYDLEDTHALAPASVIEAQEANTFPLPTGIVNQLERRDKRVYHFFCRHPEATLAEAAVTLGTSPKAVRNGLRRIWTAARLAYCTRLTDVSSGSSLLPWIVQCLARGGIGPEPKAGYGNTDSSLSELSSKLSTSHYTAWLSRNREGKWELREGEIDVGPGRSFTFCGAQQDVQGLRRRFGVRGGVIDSMATGAETFVRWHAQSAADEYVAEFDPPDTHGKLLGYWLGNDDQGRQIMAPMVVLREQPDRTLLGELLRMPD
jgi:hypothetical protein